MQFLTFCSDIEAATLRSNGWLYRNSILANADAWSTPIPPGDGTGGYFNIFPPPNGIPATIPYETSENGEAAPLSPTVGGPSDESQDGSGSSSMVTNNNNNNTNKFNSMKRRLSKSKLKTTNSCPTLRQTLFNDQNSSSSSSNESTSPFIGANGATKNYSFPNSISKRAMTNGGTNKHQAPMLTPDSPYPEIKVDIPLLLGSTIHLALPSLLTPESSPELSSAVHRKSNGHHHHMPCTGGLMSTHIPDVTEELFPSVSLEPLPVIDSSALEDYLSQLEHGASACGLLGEMQTGNGRAGGNMEFGGANGGAGGAPNPHPQRSMSSAGIRHRLMPVKATNDQPHAVGTHRASLPNINRWR